MYRYTFLILLFFTINTSAQTVSGIIVDEDQNPLPVVLVVNMKTEKTSSTNMNGQFTIEASSGQELRFVRNGFDRSSRLIAPQDFNTHFNVILRRNTEAIEEVKIVYQPTGNLKKDLPNYGDSKAVAKLKAETVKYIRSKSSPEVLAPKPGEFVQPKVSGFINGKVEDQWDNIDLLEYLLNYLGEEFFVEDLKLEQTEIQPFIFYIFRNFERRKILFDGAATTADISRFMTESYLKLDSYKNNLPNDPPAIKKRNRRK